MPVELLVSKRPKVDVSIRIMIHSLTVSYVLIFDLPEIVSVIRILDVYDCISSSLCIVQGIRVFCIYLSLSVNLLSFALNSAGKFLAVILVF